MNSSLTEFAQLVRGFWKPILIGLTALLLLSWIWNFVNQGTLRLTVNPSPAQLAIGRSVVTIGEVSETSLSPGRYRILVRKDGYLDYLATVSIEPRTTTTLEIDLLKPPIKLAEIASHAVFSVDGQSLRYLGSDSRLHQVDLSGNSSALSNLVIPEPLNFSWSPNRSRILVNVYNRKFQLQQAGSPFFSANDPDLAIVTWVYDLATERLFRIGVDMPTVDWGATDQEILYVTASNDQSAIYQANFDGTSPRKIAEITSPTVEIEVSPDGKSLIWYPHPEGFGSNNIYLIEIASGQQRALTNDGYTYGASWSPDGGTAVTNKVNRSDFSTSLSLVNLATGNRQNLGVDGDAESVVWHPVSSIIYQIDQKLKEIVSVRTSDGSTAELLRFDQGLPSDLLISPSGDRLGYIYQGSLYSLVLK